MNIVILPDGKKVTLFNNLQDYLDVIKEYAGDLFCALLRDLIVEKKDVIEVAASMERILDEYDEDNWREAIEDLVSDLQLM